ncbi:MAG: ectonucleotide pyrophosphatase/phosphodiesterase [Pseudoxanthomonas suwonensis]|nr:ectonucleotide pyrophosphatase/phosphodiesterase [Pseudoxanthomonas suwonensis]
MTILPFRLAGALLLAGLLAACQSTPTREAAAHATPSLLLVSLDGFHPRYLDESPNLRALAAEGVRAEWMTPSYPSLTFPNHYSIVTGLRPDRHGIVHNTMHDAELGDFSLANRDAVGDGRWWQGEPVWVGAEKAGLRTATMFWPGSEAPIQGVRPGRWLPYDGKATASTRVDTVLGWLDEPAATRPRLATLYFEQVDTIGHGHGPDSAEVHAAVREVDEAIGRLVNGLRDRGQLESINLIVVSDHGMAAVPAGNVVALEDMVDPANAETVSAGQSVGFAPRPGRTREAEAQLLGRHQHHECWRRNELPTRWHYGRHPRVPAIICQMDEGWNAHPRQVIQRFAQVPQRTRGSHGYDPALPSMRAIFIARGPAFRQGTVLPAVDNVDVYPLLTRLLGIPAADNDGDPRALEPALR